MPDESDSAGVLVDWHEGVRRGVLGSPHFFCGDTDVFCPSLDITKDPVQGVSIAMDAAASDRVPCGVRDPAWTGMSRSPEVEDRVAIFGAAGMIPTVRPTTIAPAHFSWNYTTYLNVVFLALFGLLYWTYRNRDQLGAGTGYAKDPVCGMQVEIVHAPASLRHGAKRCSFCSDP